MESRKEIIIYILLDITFYIWKFNEEGDEKINKN